MSPSWFRRLADIPGIQYSTPPNVDLSKLKGRQTVPTVDRFGTSESLWWETRDGGTSESPASQHALGDSRDVTADRVVRNIAEVLELPGEPGDYHFALQNAANDLYGRRREDPSLLDHVEHLYLLDMQLIQACPAAISYEREGVTSFYDVTAFSRLLRMYQTEGRVGDAAWVATVAARFSEGERPGFASARDRFATVTTEDA